MRKRSIYVVQGFDDKIAVKGKSIEEAQGTTLFDNNRTHVTHLCSMKNDQFIKISGYSSLSKQLFIDFFDHL